MIMIAISTCTGGCIAVIGNSSAVGLFPFGVNADCSAVSVASHKVPAVQPTTLHATSQPPIFAACCMLGIAERACCVEAARAATALRQDCKLLVVVVSAGMPENCGGTPPCLSRRLQKQRTWDTPTFVWGD